MNLLISIKNQINKIASFAKEGLLKDIDAVKNAVILPYSTWSVFVNRIPSKQVEPRYSGKFDNAIPDTRLKELNPYDLSMDEIEFYLNHPQLRSYKINDKEQVEKVKKMIKYLKKVQWNSALNKIIK